MREFNQTRLCNDLIAFAANRDNPCITAETAALIQDFYEVLNENKEALNEYLANSTSKPVGVDRRYKITHYTPHASDIEKNINVVFSERKKDEFLRDCIDDIAKYISDTFKMSSEEEKKANEEKANGLIQRLKDASADLCGYPYPEQSFNAMDFLDAANGYITKVVNKERITKDDVAELAKISQKFLAALNKNYDAFNSVLGVDYNFNYGRRYLPQSEVDATLKSDKWLTFLGEMVHDAEQYLNAEKALNSRYGLNPLERKFVDEEALDFYLPTDKTIAKKAKETSDKIAIVQLRVDAATNSSYVLYATDVNQLVLAAKNGILTDKLKKDENAEVRAAIVETIEANEAEAFVNDPSPIVRAAVAKKGIMLTTLAFDKNEDVRAEVARQGYGLDTLKTDPSPIVRAAVAAQGINTNAFLSDPEWLVRWAATACVKDEKVLCELAKSEPDFRVRQAIAARGIALNTLISDTDWRVRREVARQGYGLQELLYDPEEFVRAAIAEQGSNYETLSKDTSSEVQYAVLCGKRALTQRAKECVIAMQNAESAESFIEMHPDLVNIAKYIIARQIFPDINAFRYYDVYEKHYDTDFEPSAVEWAKNLVQADANIIISGLYSEFPVYTDGNTTVHAFISSFTEHIEPSPSKALLKNKSVNLIKKKENLER